MIEKFMSLFERLVVGVESLALETKKKVELAETWVKGETTPQKLTELPGKTEAEFLAEVGKEFNKEPANVSGPESEPLSYEQMLEKHGLPYLKELCKERGIVNFPSAARSNTVIRLLKDRDAQQKNTAEPAVVVEEAPPVKTEEPDPFTTIEIPESDPFDSDEVLTLDDVRKKLMDLRTVIESKKPGKGTEEIINMLSKFGGVKILKDLPEDKFKTVSSAASVAIAGYMS